MAGLLFIHNYNYYPFVITPSTRVEGPFSVTNFIELLFSNSLLRFRMGLLMTISGYLMANSKPIKYIDLLFKKAKTLLVPYVLISIIGLIVTFLFEILYFGWHNTQSTGMIGKSLWNFTWKDYINYIFVSPVSFQLWYLKTIFTMAVLSPAVKFLLEKIPITSFAITFVIWMFTNYLDGETRDRCFIFYGLGYYLRLYNKNIEKPMDWFNPYWALAIYFAISIFRATISFYTPTHFAHLKYILTITFKLNEIFSLYAVWFCFQGLVKRFLYTRFYHLYCNCSFFVYAFHAPFINYLSQCLRWSNIYTIHGAHLVMYILLPALVFPLMIILDKYVKLYFPNFFALVSGGRGTPSKRKINSNNNSQLV